MDSIWNKYLPIMSMMFAIVVFWYLDRNMSILNKNISNQQSRKHAELNNSLENIWKHLQINTAAHQPHAERILQQIPDETLSESEVVCDDNDVCALPPPTYNHPAVDKAQDPPSKRPSPAAQQQVHPVQYPVQHPVQPQPPQIQQHIPSQMDKPQQQQQQQPEQPEQPKQEQHIQEQHIQQQHHIQQQLHIHQQQLGREWSSHHKNTEPSDISGSQQTPQIDPRIVEITGS